MSEWTRLVTEGPNLALLVLVVLEYAFVVYSLFEAEPRRCTPSRVYIDCGMITLAVTVAFTIIMIMSIMDSAMYANPWLCGIVGVASVLTGVAFMLYLMRKPPPEPVNVEELARARAADAERATAVALLIDRYDMEDALARAIVRRHHGRVPRARIDAFMSMAHGKTDAERTAAQTAFFVSLADAKPRIVRPTMSSIQAPAGTSTPDVTADETPVHAHASTLRTRKKGECMRIAAAVAAAAHIGLIDITREVRGDVAPIVHARGLFSSLRLERIDANIVALASMGVYGHSVARVMTWHVRAPQLERYMPNTHVYIVCDLVSNAHDHDVLVFTLTSERAAASGSGEVDGGIELQQGARGDMGHLRSPVAWPCRVKADAAWASEHWHAATVAIVECVYAQAVAHVTAMRRAAVTDASVNKDMYDNMYEYLECARFTEGTLAALWK